MKTSIKIGVFVGSLTHMLSTCGRSTAPMDSPFFMGEMGGALVSGILLGALLGWVGGKLFPHKNEEHQG